MCGICGKLNQNFLCQKCNNTLKNQAKFNVENFQKKEKYFKELLYIFKYEGIIRKTILKYKFQEGSYLYKTFVNFILKNQKFFEFIKSYDTIVPVPISNKRYKERGYNQSYLLAREISRNTMLKLQNRSIIKNKNIIEQSKLNKEERKANIQGVYKLIDSKNIKNKNIILIDDVYTTGSTVNECARVLQQARPKSISVLVIAKD